MLRSVEKKKIIILNEKFGADSCHFAIFTHFHPILNLLVKTDILKVKTFLETPFLLKNGANDQFFNNLGLFFFFHFITRISKILMGCIQIIPPIFSPEFGIPSLFCERKDFLVSRYFTFNSANLMSAVW